ncbi:TetR/AcrR family transcriptional regulator [Mycobacterium sp.]|uniref:TetR/AcrR family transcriptional regulator n=1 Tax=Mycobacterium sp. TaxID=1785 RepID=UPI003BAF1F71
MTARGAQTIRLGFSSRSGAQMRTLNAALALFAEHGVGATSYQMIADASGVTKGAIYHQFKTKDEIIIAVAEMELAKLDDALEAAEAISHSEGATFGPHPKVEDIANNWADIRGGSLPNELDGEAMAWGVQAYSTRLQASGRPSADIGVVICA